MPCFNNEDSARDRKKQVEKIHRLTRLLCEATNKMYDNKVPMSDELYDWFKDHLEQDKNRKKKLLKDKKELESVLSTYDRLTYKEIENLGNKRDFERRKEDLRRVEEELEDLKHISLE